MLPIHSTSRISWGFGSTSLKSSGGLSGAGTLTMYFQPSAVTMPLDIIRTKSFSYWANGATSSRSTT